MKIVYDPKTTLDHIKEMKEILDETVLTRKIHSFGAPIVIGIINFLVCFLTGKILIPTLISILLMFLVPKILFLLLPSCQIPIIPTPKMFCHEAMMAGKIIKVNIENFVILW